MCDIKNFNIRAMIALIAMAENNFIICNACLDLGITSGEVSYQLKRIQIYFDYPIFVKQKKAFHHKRKYIVGFTDEGYELYKNIKLFTEALDIKKYCFVDEVKKSFLHE